MTERVGYMQFADGERVALPPGVVTVSAPIRIAKADAQRVAIAQVRLITGNPRMGWKAVRKWIKRWRENVCSAARRWAR